MRPPRFKPDHVDTWHHCFNRASGFRGEQPLDDEAKTVFIRILMKLARLYVVEIVAYCFMDNHFHLLLRVPREAPSEEETIRRYTAYHQGRLELRPGSPQARHWQARLRDISAFMQHFQQNCTRWYNGHFPEPRRGSFWGSRFKNSVLEPGLSVARCWAYIENNPVGAGMVPDPGAYRFSSFGRFMASGSHPFADEVRRLLLPMLGLDQLKDLIGWLMPADQAAEAQRLLPTMGRRAHYWRNGLVIGSEAFVRSVVAKVWNPTRAFARRLSEVPGSGDKLYAWCRPAAEA